MHAKRIVRASLWTVDAKIASRGGGDAQKGPHSLAMRSTRLPHVVRSQP